MKTAGIYQITCLANGKKYIGSSLSIERRFTNHKTHLKYNKHTNSHLQNAWNKYGKVSFVFEILEKVENATVEIIRTIEQEILDSYSENWDCLFNIATTVDMTVISDEIRAKMIASIKANPRSEESRAAAGERFKALWQDPEYRAKAEKAGKDRWLNPNNVKNHKEAINKPEVLAKNSARGKKLWQDPEYREKIVGASLERWDNPEYKLKLTSQKRISGGGISSTKSGKYRARISNRHKQINLGVFDTHEQALVARLKAEEYYWGGEYKLNEERLKRGEHSAKMWSDPEYKKRLTNKLRKSGSGIRVAKSGRYIACISVNRQQIRLGTFDTYDEALIARLEAEKLYWGESDAN
jgi:group I intron endonuclease